MIVWERSSERVPSASRILHRAQHSGAVVSVLKIVTIQERKAQQKSTGII